MYVEPENYFHLTYCTNIHPGNGWQEVYANLQRYVPALQTQFAPHKSFGIGLRLSDSECCELLQGDHLEQFQEFLRAQNLYVFTLNGFPYGPFHQQPVKASVHAPDWLQDARVTYTLRLIEILEALLPADIDGGISTSPLSYKAWVNQDDPTIWRRLTHNIVRIALSLIRIKREQGKRIHLDIEPEPDGLLENSDDVVRFYTHWLLEEGSRMLARSLVISREQARAHLLEHIRICFDTCHVAVAYEDPSAILDRFAQVGIQIGKVQISSALKIVFPAEEEAREALARALMPFAESTYLHQVVQQDQMGSLRGYPDLLDALPSIQDAQIAQWRIHFHVPVFMKRFPTFHSTQDTIVDTFRLLTQRRFCRHLEIETYTWSVLPAYLKNDLLDSVAREYEWVLRNLSEMTHEEAGVATSGGV